MYEGVIFDVDGTLVDSNDAHARAWVEAFAEAGHPVPFERVRRLVGMGGDQLLPEAAGLSAEAEPGRSIAKRRGEVFEQKFLPQLRPLPGARELVARLRHDGYRLGVASSAQPAELEPLLRLAGVEDLLRERTSAGDVEESKPEPDIVLAALRKLRLGPSAALMIGDTPYDVEAARRAGVALIAFRSGGWSDPDLRGALAVYDGPADLLARIESSPLRRAA
ncbi:MAG TPA: HAD family hydrolase [Vicinamibacteria bacterium]